MITEDTQRLHRIQLKSVFLEIMKYSGGLTDKVI